MTEKQRPLSAILQNPHFNQYVAVLSTAASLSWRALHPQFPNVWVTMERLMKLVEGLHADSIKKDFLVEWTRLFAGLVETDPKLFYTVQNLEWLVALLDGDPQEAKTTLAMLLAAASTQQEVLTVEDVAAITGTAPSTWRARAARGEIISQMAGKTRLITKTALRAYGVEIPRNLVVIDAQIKAALLVSARQITAHNSADPAILVNGLLPVEDYQLNGERKPGLRSLHDDAWLELRETVGRKSQSQQYRQSAVVVYYAVQLEEQSGESWLASDLQSMRIYHLDSPLVQQCAEAIYAWRATQPGNQEDEAHELKLIEEMR